MVKLTADLVLARCRGSDIESITKLNCWSSELDDVSIIRQMPKIEVVSLSVNDISTLADFQTCKNLQELYIRKNKIKNLNEICYLKKLPKLRILWLADNPCAVGNLYRMTVLKTLPNLTKLDNVVVEEDELNDSITQGVDLQLPNVSPIPAASPVKPTSTVTSSAECITQGGPEAVTKARTRSTEETNQIRAEMGLKPVSEEKLTTPSKSGSGGKHRNTNILNAVLLLIKELDSESLDKVICSCKERLEAV